MLLDNMLLAILIPESRFTEDEANDFVKSLGCKLDLAECFEEYTGDDMSKALDKYYAMYTYAGYYTYKLGNARWANDEYYVVVLPNRIMLHTSYNEVNRSSFDEQDDDQSGDKLDEQDPNQDDEIYEPLS